jgi:hypothetical protein
MCERWASRRAGGDLAAGRTGQASWDAIMDWAERFIKLRRCGAR